MCERCALDWRSPADLVPMRVASYGTRAKKPIAAA
jgi:hypothetical protein